MVEKADVQALVTAVQTACRLETHISELTDGKLEKLRPYLGWKPLEVAKMTGKYH